MNDKIGIVFINGAGLNSSVWNDLEKKVNVPVLRVEFPNRKSGNKENASLTFEDYVTPAVTEIKNWQRSFIIVAHSIGACVGLQIATHFKRELKGFIAVGSVIPKSGQSFLSSLPFPQKFILPVLLSLFGTKPPARRTRKLLIHRNQRGNYRYSGN